jgi:hypothetical protein
MANRMEEVLHYPEVEGPRMPIKFEVEIDRSWGGEAFLPKKSVMEKPLQIVGLW